jgi:hypothetical protein
MEGNILRNSVVDIPACTSVNTRCVHSHSSDSLINVGNLVSAQENLPKEGKNPVSVNSDLISQNLIPPIKIYALNVCGIISKLKFSDIEENCANNDILCFFESKIDDLDEIEFSGFVKLPPLNRKKL